MWLGSGLRIGIVLTKADVDYLFLEFHRRWDVPEGANERDHWLGILNDRGMSISQAQRILGTLEDRPLSPQEFADHGD